jgi:fibronectin-binding autotransporter adhesin
MPRQMLAFVTFAVALVLSNRALAQTPAHWTNAAGGNWNVPGNWGGGVVPNNGFPLATDTYSAFIDAAGTYTVTLNSPIGITNLTMNDASATLQVTGSTLTIVNSTTLTAGVIQLTSGTIMGGMMTSTGGRLAPSFSTGTLSGVNLGLNVLDMSGGRVALTNGTNFTGGPGTITLGSSSQIFVAEAATIPSGTIFALGNSSSVSADGGFTATLDAATTDTVTINVLGSNAAIGGGFQNSAANSILINKGRVQFDPATVGGSLSISSQGAGSRFRNEGKLVASSSGAANTINLSGGSYTNAGTIVAATGGVVNLNGTFTRADLGTFTNTGGTINIAGTLNNTSLDLDNTTGTLTMVAGTIVGGTVSAAGTAHLRPTFTTSTLNGVSLGINVLDMLPGGRIALTNGTTFTGGPGTITFGNSSQIFIAQAATIPSGTIFALGANASVSADGGFTVTLDAATTDTVTINVLASNAAIGSGFQSSTPNSILINKGRVQFDPATVGASLNISSQGAGSRFRNEGKLVASSSGAANTINLNPPFTNAGTLIAGTGGIINLNGTFTRADLGTFSNTGGTINITGTVNNTSSSLDLDNTTGSVTLAAGTIMGGTVTATGTAHLRPNTSSSNILNAVTLGINVLDLMPNSSRVQLTGGTNLTGGPGVISLGNGSQVFIGQTTTIPSGTSFAMASNSSVSADGGFTVTLGAATPQTVTATVITGGSGTVVMGTSLLAAAPNSVLINQGTIQFNPTSTNSVLSFQTPFVTTGNSIQNQGIISVNAVGATVNFGSNTTFTNSGTITANGGTFNIPSTGVTFTNYNAGTQTLTGGTYQVFASSVINFNGRAIGTLGAGTSILLDGASSIFTAANTITTNNGSLTISNGRQFTAMPPGSITNNGTLTVGTIPNDTALFNGGVNVGGSGIVKGAGTIAGPVNFASGTTLAPGTSPGILHITGAVTMTSGATLSIDLSGNTVGPGYSQLSLIGGGSVNLNNATLAIFLNYAPAGTDEFFIINGGVVSGIFNGLPNGSVVTLGTFGGTEYKANIVYGATSVLLTAVTPEPAHILLVGAAGAGVLGWYRRRTAKA